ncbi:MAG: hypothetical protein LBQ36_03030, partial [Synergistaceae bacterium]|nr:hypothetical protein [Synergistaceae bacterium]
IYPTSRLRASAEAGAGDLGRAWRAIQTQLICRREPCIIPLGSTKPRPNGFNLPKIISRISREGIHEDFQKAHKNDIVSNVIRNHGRVD